jgi:hypothetical protein
MAELFSMYRRCVTRHGFVQLRHPRREQVARDPHAQGTNIAMQCDNRTSGNKICSKVSKHAKMSSRACIEDQA